MWKTPTRARLFFAMFIIISLVLMWLMVLIAF